MSCCQCQGIETEFNQKRAEKELKKYRRKGPSKTTRMLLAALKDAGVKDMSLLDIGGGVGAIQHELIKAGVGKVVNVDASGAYSKAANEEAVRQGHADKISFYHGDFVDLAPKLPAADVVTLDRVICCYHNVDALVGLSAERAGKLYGAVYPRDAWWVKMVFSSLNFFLRVFRHQFRAFVHPTEKVETLVRNNGLISKKYYGTSGFWQIVVFTK